MSSKTLKQIGIGFQICQLGMPCSMMDPIMVGYHVLQKVDTLVCRVIKKQVLHIIHVLPRARPFIQLAAVVELFDLVWSTLVPLPGQDFPTQ